MQARLLGPLRVESNGSQVDLGPPKQRALLALLLLNANRVVPAERLIELIWAERPPRTAAHSLQVYVSDLRKAIPNGEHVIETRAPGYKLTIDPADLDIVDFQRLIEDNSLDRLRQARESFEDAPLADFRYEEWAQPHIRRIEGLQAKAVEMLAASELEEGRPDAVEELVIPLIEREPLREEPRRLLMLGLYGSGRHAEALRVYSDFRKALGEELGVEPSPDLAQLEEQILLHDPPLISPRPAARLVPATARNPYKGLGSFDETDAADFFGRDKSVDGMIVMLDEGRRLLVAVGPSGSGKSSIVRAGLIPALRRGEVDGSERWVVTSMTPGRHPLEQLEAALGRSARSAPTGVLEQLTESSSGLLRVALQILPDERAELVLVIDQFEEIFTLATDRQRRRTLDNLVTAVTDPRSRIRIILTLRADFYDRPLLSSRFAPVFSSGVVNIVPLDATELEAAIVGPAAAVGVTVEPSLLAMLIRDMSDAPAALPLLQFTLTELFKLRHENVLTPAEYEALGGIRGALSARADEVYNRFGEADRGIAKTVFLHLVSLERDSQAARRRASLDDLRALGDVDEVVGAFIAERLLTADRDAISGLATVQVIHESLLSGWRRLKEWIETYSADLQRRSALATAAAEWEANDRHPDYALTGRRLAECELWSHETDLGIGRVEREFLDASIARRDALETEDGVRRQRETTLALRARRRLWGLVVAAAVLAGSAGYALYATRPEPLPDVAFVSTWRNSSGPVEDLVNAGLDRAQQELDVSMGVFPDIDVVDYESGFKDIVELSERGVRFLVASDPDMTFAARQAAPDFPSTRFVLMDAEAGTEPNVAYWRYAENEGSFLVGAAAALRSRSGIVGFVGGVDMPLIHRFQAGYEAGARFVRPDVVVVVEYLSPGWDFSGFNSRPFAQKTAETMYADGADVIYHAAGISGWGVFEAAARESDRQGRHLWAIGVDADEYFAVLDEGEPGTDQPDPSTWQPHILTSMIKRFDIVTFTVLAELGEGRFTPGPRVAGLAEGAVDYSTSGGFIDDLVPQLEALRARIISGDIVVPDTIAVDDRAGRSGGPIGG